MFSYWLAFLLDLFPFLPFWYLLALSWGIGVIIITRQKEEPFYFYSALLALVLTITAPLLWFFRPKAVLLCLGLVLLLFLFNFALLGLKALKKALTPRLKKLYQGELWIIIFAVAGGILITSFYHQPKALVWRLGLYPSPLAEKWLAENRNREKVAGSLIRGLKPEREAAIFRVLSKIAPDYPLSPAQCRKILNYLEMRRDKLNRESLLYAVRLLGEIKTESARPFFIQSLKNLPPEEEQVFPFLLAALKALPQEPVKAELKKAFLTNPADSGEILKAFSQLGGEFDPEEIKALAENPSPKVRLKILSYLAGKSQICSTDLSPFLRDIYPEVRERALQVCGDRRLKALIPLVLPLLKDRQAQIRSRANSVLIELSGENPGFNYLVPDLKKEQEKWEKILPTP